MADEKDNPDDSPLNDRQKLFVDYYLANGLNATQAAKRAGYSAETAYSMGPRLLKNVEIRAQVDARLKEATMSADEVLYRMTEIARGTMDDFLDLPEYDPEFPSALQNRVSINLPKAREAGKLGLVKKFGFDERGNPTLELYGADAALRDLGRYHKLFTDKTEVTGKDGGPIETADANLTDPERLARLASLFDAARTRRDGQAADDAGADAGA
jgi:phage terminase small subunit